VDPSVFRDRSRIPTDAELEAALGSSIGLWRSVVAALAREFDPVAEEWSFAGKAHGWSLRVGHRGRAIVYLAPLAGRFRASLALPERAMPAALDAPLPESVGRILSEAPVYPEGRAVRLEVGSPEDVASVLTLARIRMTI
jgi:hypothetical protein